MSRRFNRHMLPVVVLIAGAILLNGCADRSDTARSGPQPVHGAYVSGGVGIGL